jgi:hypothetical protein
MVGRLVNNELKRMPREAVMTYLMHYPGIFLEGPNKTMKTFCQDSRYPCQYSKRQFPNTSKRHYYSKQVVYPLTVCMVHEYEHKTAQDSALL